MLLYLGNSDNESIIKILKKRKLIIKNISGEINFKNFAFHDTKSLDHYDLVLLNLESLLDSEDEMIETFKAFKLLYKPRLIVFTENPSKKFLYRIAKEANLYDIVFPFEDENIEDTLLKCLDNKISYREQIRRYIKKINLDYDIPYKDTKILVGGISSTFNTTKVALNLATFLNEIGTKISYIEASSNSYLKKILNHYKVEALKQEDISFFYNAEIPLNFDFNIIDIGLLEGKSLGIFNSLDFGEVKIICSSTKQFEIDKLISMLEKNNEAIAILIYSSKKEKNIAKRRLKNKSQVYFIDNSITFFDNSNSSIYKKILNKFIVPIS